MDISFITHLIALEAKGILTYYQEDRTAHDALMDGFVRLSPKPELNLGLWRREGPLDSVEQGIAKLDRHPIQRIIFRIDYYAGKDGLTYVAAYTTAKDPPVNMITLSELLWFRAENDVVMEFVAHAVVDTSLPDEQRTWVYLGGECPLELSEVEPFHTDRSSLLPMDSFGKALLA